MKNTKWKEELVEVLTDLVDEYFPKIKPEGKNSGRGEAMVIVAIALSEFEELLSEQKMQQEKLVEKVEGLKKKRQSNRTTDEKRYPIGFNSAINQVLNLLKESKL